MNNLIKQKLCHLNEQYKKDPLKSDENFVLKNLHIQPANGILKFP